MVYYAPAFYKGRNIHWPGIKPAGIPADKLIDDKGISI